MALYSICRNDVERARAVLTDAFRNDPFFTYMLGPGRYDGTTARPVHSFTLGLGLRFGRVYAPSAAIEAVAIWLPPGHTGITAVMSLRSGVIGLRACAPEGHGAGLAFARRMIGYSAYSEGLHKKHVPFPHWYLLSIGVPLADRGKGYASLLLKPVLAECDKDGLGCYLETHNRDNLALYEHFGFVVKEEGRLPGSSAPHWAMLRNPRSK